MCSILPRFHQTSVATSGEQAAVIVEQPQSYEHAFDARVYVIVAHLIMRAHFGTPGLHFKISKSHSFLLQMQCGPAIVCIKVFTVLRNSCVVCLAKYGKDFDADYGW